MFYAQLNEENICIGISQLSGEVKAENMIELDGYDTPLLGKRWTRQGWEEVPRPEQEAPAPTVDRLARLEAQTLLLADAIADIYEELLGKAPAELKELVAEKNAPEHPAKGAE